MLSPTDTFHKRKPSYFKTLPESIADSPTGITKIPNSPFPSLGQTKQFKSVYERAGFDIYRGESVSKSPKIPGDNRGLRSSSTSQLPGSPRNQFRYDKRNGTEVAHQHDANRKAHPNLRIDPISANSAYKARNFSSGDAVGKDIERLQARSASALIGSQGPHHRSYPQNDSFPSSTSAVSSLFDTRSGISQSPDIGQIIPGSAFVTATSLQQETSPSNLAHSSGLSSRGSNPNLPRDSSNESLSRAGRHSNHLKTSLDQDSKRFSAQRIEGYSGRVSPERYDHDQDRLSLQKSQELSDRKLLQQNDSADSHILSPRDSKAYSTIFTPLNDDSSSYSSPQNDKHQTKSAVTQSSPDRSFVKLSPGKSRPVLESEKSFDATPSDFKDKNLTSHITPQRAPPPDTSPIVPIQKEFQELSIDTGNSLRSNGFIPKPLVNAVTPTQPTLERLPNTEDSTDNEIHVCSDDDDDYSDVNLDVGSLKPKNQRSGFQDSNPELYDNDEDSDPEIVNDFDDDDEVSPSHLASPQLNDSQDPATEGSDTVSKQRTAIPSISSTTTLPQPLTQQKDIQNPQIFNEPDSIRTTNELRNSSLSMASSVYTSDAGQLSPRKSFAPSFTPRFQGNHFNALPSPSIEGEVLDQAARELSPYHKSKSSSYEDSLSLSARSVENSSIPSPASSLENQMGSLKEFSQERLTKQALENPSNDILISKRAIQMQNIPSIEVTGSEISPYNATIKDHSPQHETQAEKEIKYPPGEGPCRKCGLAVDVKPIYSKSGELSGKWHRSCFTCSFPTCDLKFSKEIKCFVLNDLPYCEHHFHSKNNSLCKICGSGIVGQCLENDAMDRYHLDCLKCTTCENAITSDYLSVNEKIYCEPCVFECSLNNSTKIEKRRTRIGFI